MTRDLYGQLSPDRLNKIADRMDRVVHSATDLGLSGLGPGLGAPGRIRTSDTRFRRAVLYPLSYGGR